MIRYYLGEEPILPQRADVLLRDDERAYVLEHLESWWSSRRRGGRLRHADGPAVDRRERDDVRRASAEPRNYIAHRARAVARARPIVRSASVEPRHVDLRPFILHGREGARRAA